MVIFAGRMVIFAGIMPTSYIDSPKTRGSYIATPPSRMPCGSLIVILAHVITYLSGAWLYM